MKGVIIVPCYRRADFLWACLTRLMQCDGIADYWIRIAIDRGASDEVKTVASTFYWQKQLNVIIDRTPDHPYPGNSYNVLTAYRRAVEHSLDSAGGEWIIHELEEDIFVGKDYLRFHEQAWKQFPHAFAVSACRDQNGPQKHASPSADPRACVFEADTYQSLGVSFQRKTLVVALGHAREDYFRDMAGTLAREFPGTKIPRGQAEQDGLFGRVLEQQLSPEFLSLQDNAAGIYGMIYPVEPRAYHAGFVGANRSAGRPLYDGTPEERGRQLLAMSEEEMLGRCDSRFRDIHQADLEMKWSGDLALIR